MWIVNNKYDRGEEVYIKTDPEQFMYLVIGFIVQGHDTLYVCQSAAQGTYNAFEFELTKEKSVIAKMGL